MRLRLVRRKVAARGALVKWGACFARSNHLNGSLTRSADTAAMSNYRRPARSAAPVFFTVPLANRGGDLLVREIARLREAVRVTRAERPFAADAWVVLPDHMHCIWRVPDGDYSVRWGAIKARFSRSLFETADAATNYRPDCRPGLSPAYGRRNANGRCGRGGSGTTISAMRRISPRICGIAGRTR